MQGSRTGTTSQYKHKTLNFQKSFRLSETVMYVLLLLCTTISIVTTLGIIYILVSQAIPFFREVSLIRFFTSADWQPRISQFGVLPLLTATTLTSFIAVCIATPLAIVMAIYLSEYASMRVRNMIKPTLEVLAGIPSVVYGYFAVDFMTPLLQSALGKNRVEIYNTASAGIVIGILILPILVTMIDDALSSVPKTLREASYGIGATKIKTSLQIVIPAAFSGIAAAFILGFSRAVGETMIVALAAGAGSNLTLNPFKGAETMTGYIVRISGGDVSYNSIDYTSIFAIGLVLFTVTFLLNIASRRIVRRYKKDYLS